jgi:P2-related tail formation protein
MQQRSRRISLDELLIYFIDTVSARLLPVLAEEFDVLGVKGWDFATTEEEQRDLLKKSIFLKRYRGTRWSVEEALKMTQYTIYNFQEGTSHWAKFRITVSQNDYPIDVQQLTLATALVNEYKNLRSTFEGMWVSDIDYADAATATEDLIIHAKQIHLDSVASTGQFLYDGTITYSGIRNYQNETDCLKINIV